MPSSQSVFDQSDHCHVIMKGESLNTLSNGDGLISNNINVCLYNETREPW